MFLVPSGLWDRSGGLNYKVSLLPVSPAHALQIRGVGPSFPYFLQHSTAGTERGVVIRLLVMPLAMDSSTCYPEIPQTFCLSQFPGILVLMRDIFQFFVFHWLFKSFAGKRAWMSTLMLPLLCKASSLILFMNTIKISSLNGFNLGCCFRGNSK